MGLELARSPFNGLTGNPVQTYRRILKLEWPRVPAIRPKQRETFSGTAVYKETPCRSLSRESIDAFTLAEMYVPSVGLKYWVEGCSFIAQVLCLVLMLLDLPLSYTRPKTSEKILVATQTLTPRNPKP